MQEMRTNEHVGEQFNKDVEMLRKQGALEKKNSVNQIKNKVKNINNIYIIHKYEYKIIYVFMYHLSFRFHIHI
jgi:hypothetical protein